MEKRSNSLYFFVLSHFVWYKIIAEFAFLSQSCSENIFRLIYWNRMPASWRRRNAIRPKYSKENEPQAALFLTLRGCKCVSYVSFGLKVNDVKVTCYGPNVLNGLGFILTEGLFENLGAAWSGTSQTTRTRNIPLSHRENMSPTQTKRWDQHSVKMLACWAITLSHGADAESNLATNRLVWYDGFWNPKRQQNWLTNMFGRIAGWPKLSLPLRKLHGSAT